MDANALIHAADAIKTMQAAGLLSVRAAKVAKQSLLSKLSECMEQWSEREQWDIVEALNSAYRKASA
jgi:hypothetical protein